MSKKYNVYGLGNAIVDIITEVPDTFLDENNVEKGIMTLVDEEKQGQLLQAIDLQKSNQQCGGSGANSIIAISQLGGKSYYACKVASDDFGNFYLKDLQSNGVETNLEKVELPEGITGKCLVMTTPDAARTMNTFLGITAGFSNEQLEREVIKQSEYIYIEGYLVSSETGFQALLEAQKIAKEEGIKVAITFSDPSMVKFFNDNMHKAVANGVDLLFCNEEEAKLFANTADLDEAVIALKKITKELVITKGAEGAVVYHEGEEIQIAPHQVDAIDTNGAGDLFAGAYLYGITNGKSRKESGELASLLSSKVVTQFGPRLTKEQAQELK